MVTHLNPTRPRGGGRPNGTDHGPLDGQGSDPRTDAELVTAVRAEAIEAYAELYRRHQRDAFAFALALTRDPDLARDVSAEAFARVLAALLDGLGPHTDFRRYLLVTVRNLSYRMGARRRRDLIVAEPPAPERDTPAPPHLLQDPALTEAFGRLPERWQRLLWRSAIDGLSLQELAAELEVSPATAAARTYRARTALRASLAAVASERVVRDAVEI